MSERKSCHNCRRRRLRCDRSVPACYKCTKTGQRCLGYGQIYRWVDSETSSGHESQRRGASLTSSAECDSLLLRRAYHGELSDLSTLNTLGDGPQEPLNSFLADPLLQDLSASNRRYMFYYASRFCQDLVVHDSVELGTNPFRELIPMSQTYSYLQHIIIAVSAVHYHHAIRNATSDTYGLSSTVRHALIDALHARQEAIRELIAIIQQRQNDNNRVESQADQDALLATVLFFINFTLIDSGRDGWKNHLTAAGRLLSVHGSSTLPLLLGTEDDGQPDYPSPFTIEQTSLSGLSTPRETCEAMHRPLCRPLTACDYVTSDTVAYFIWNCALECLVAPPSSPPSSSSSAHSLDYTAQLLTWDVAKVLSVLSRTEANSYHSCPAHLMGIVLQTARVTQYRKINGSRFPAAAQMDAYLNLLKEAETFDIEQWAAGLSTHIIDMLGVLNEQEIRLRCHIAATYRAAVCLFILLVAPGLPAEVRRRARLTNSDIDALPTLPTTEDLASTILQQLSFIPKTSPLFKYTLWPVFLTGVDAVSTTRRVWVNERLRAMLDVCPWGMLTSAMETLAEIWKLRDGAPKSTVDETGLSDKTPELGQVGEDNSDWLARLQGLKIDCLIV